ncbi:CHAT domain-containing protein [Dactylosporangium sp. NPDC049525]|uniref:CHAT domain-containing protein n=1 Tax=Dactylosporangium sp. NPDC049525 TaxID=3154730 RepID=UPI0034296A4A
MGAATATELHQQAQREAERGRRAAAYVLLQRALTRDPDPVRRAHILISLAYHEAERRRLMDGLALLDEADSLPDLPAGLRALTASQRGLLYQRAGELNRAASCYDLALGLFSEAEPQDMCRNLLNRGLVNMQRGRNRAARSDFARCADIAARHGLDLLAAKASHNLGYLHMLAGDLPTALRTMDGVAPVLMTQSPLHAGVYHFDRSQALLAAGLFREADEELRTAATLFQAARSTHDLAVAELGQAQLALLDERWADAGAAADRARRRFAGRGTACWAMLAGHVAIAARVGSGSHRAATAQAVRLADRLQGAGLHDEARRSRLTAALAALAGAGTGRVARARRAAGQAIELRARDPIATRLQARTVRAALADAAGNPGDADRERRGAMADVHRYQASFGSLDLQTAIGSHAHRIAEDGLARALSTGRPATVFGWAERARALSARLPPVLPPDNDEAADLLEELRQARRDLREHLLAGRADTRLRVRCAQLEQLVRQRSWYTPGPAQTLAPAPLPRLRERLGASSATFVAHLTAGDRLCALVVTARHQAVVDLGSAEPVLETQRRLRRDLDLLALDTVPKEVRATIRASSRSALARLDAALWQPLRAALLDGPVLLAPSAQLAAAPWTLMATLRGRAVAVVPSVTAWLAAHERPPMPPAPTVAFAAGPDLARAGEEIRLLARVWSLPDTAVTTTADVRAAAARVDILHVVAHGAHEPDNPLFSHLLLGDGPLFGHEFERLAKLPHHVVLSACELGLTGARPADETLGMTVAILHAGAHSVVAGVALVSDAIACRVAAAHHGGLRRGLPPAAALAGAIGALDPDDDPPPLVCFGAGW